MRENKNFRDNCKKTIIIRARFNSKDYHNYMKAKEYTGFKSASHSVFIRECCIHYQKKIQIDTIVDEIEYLKIRRILLSLIKLYKVLEKKGIEVDSIEAEKSLRELEKAYKKYNKKL